MPSSKLVLALSCLFAAWFLVEFTTCNSSLKLEQYNAIEPADCGKEPPWTNKDAWYEFGDCSGDYGPIDAEDDA